MQKYLKSRNIKKASFGKNFEIWKINVNIRIFFLPTFCAVWAKLRYFGKIHSNIYYATWRVKPKISVNTLIINIVHNTGLRVSLSLRIIYLRLTFKMSKNIYIYQFL